MFVNLAHGHSSILPASLRAGFRSRCLIPTLVFYFKFKSLLRENKLFMKGRELLVSKCISDYENVQSLVRIGSKSLRLKL